MDNNRPHLLDNLDILDTYYLDMMPHAQRIEQRLFAFLRPLPERIYVGSDLVGIDLHRGYYFTRINGQRARVRSLEDIIAPVYQQIGDDESTAVIKQVISAWHIKTRNIYSTPKGPKRGLDILFDYIQYYVDSILPYCRGSDFHAALDKHIVLTPQNSPGVFRQRSEDADDDFYYEMDNIKCDIANTVEELCAGIHRFVGLYREHLYFTKREQTIMLIQRSIDRRAWKWLQMMDKGEDNY